MRDCERGIPSAVWEGERGCQHTTEAKPTKAAGNAPGVRKKKEEEVRLRPTHHWDKADKVGGEEHAEIARDLRAGGWQAEQAEGEKGQV